MPYFTAPRESIADLECTESKWFLYSPSAKYQATWTRIKSSIGAYPKASLWIKTPMIDRKARNVRLIVLELPVGDLE